MKQQNLLLIVFVPLFICSCMSTIRDDDYSSIDPKLKPYADDFVAQARARGIDINTWNLKLQFGKCPDNVCGLTTYPTTTILIDTLQFTRTTILEEVVFHEFGHLYLHREHDDKKLIQQSDERQVAKSLMSTKSSVKYKYFPVRKAYYLDELFNEKTACPQWATLDIQ